MKRFTKDEISQLQYAPLSEWWDEGNNKGDGFPVGEEDDSLHRIKGLKYLFKVDNDSVLSMDRSGDLLVIGDAHGPWAVRVGKKAREWLDS